MPDAAPEVVYTGAAQPPSWGERARRFVKEKVIDPHTPEAHFQDIMRKYFWVTDRLEGPSLEIAERIRPQVEFAARAAGWSQTFAELSVAGSAVAVSAIIAGKGLKSVAEVFAGLVRRHGSETSFARLGLAKLIVPVAPKPAHLYVPPHVSPGRASGFARVTAQILDQPPKPAKFRVNGKSDADWLAKAMRGAMDEYMRQKLHDTVMQTAGKEAWSFGDYLRERLPQLPDGQRRHAQRALAHILKGLLIERGDAPAEKRDPKQTFLDALEKTSSRGEGLSNGSIDQVFAALQQFNMLT